MSGGRLDGVLVALFAELSAFGVIAGRNRFVPDLIQIRPISDVPQILFVSVLGLAPIAVAVLVLVLVASWPSRTPLVVGFRVALPGQLAVTPPVR